MRSLLVLLLVCGLSSVANAAGNPTAGQALSAPCAACHGADGKSVAPNYPNLAGQNQRYLSRQLRAIKTKAREAPLMAGQLDLLNDQNLQDLAAYFADKQAAVSQAPDKADLLKIGEQIYRGGLLDKRVPACSACHSPMGNGNAPAGFPLLRGLSVDYVSAQLTAYREGVRKTDEEYGQMMRMTASRLTDGEIKAVASYIQGLTSGLEPKAK